MLLRTARQRLLKVICFCNLVGAGSLDGLLEVSLAATTAGLCAGGLTPGGLVGRGGTAAIFINIRSRITTFTQYYMLYQQFACTHTYMYVYNMQILTMY